MNIGLLGMGTVGGGVRELAERLPSIHVVRILDRVLTRPEMTNNIEDILQDSSISLVVETMGGLHPAYEFAVKVLESGRHFVTANKLLVSKYGRELQALARQHGVGFLFGAACGGGIPYLSNLSSAREGDCILRVGGILNGTTNYMLDAMQTRNLDYTAALREAQSLGYAEQDPTSDVEGLDTLRKLILAIAVGMNCWLREPDIPVHGISGVLPLDIAWAKRSGYALRLCAFGEEKEGRLSACVEPVMCLSSSAEAAVTGNLNQAWYEGVGCGVLRFGGQGAGRYPTAANVLRDVLDLQGGARYMLPDDCSEVPLSPEQPQTYYLRLPQDIAVPEWASEIQDAGAYRTMVTAPIAPQAVYALADQNKNVFFARLQKE